MAAPPWRRMKRTSSAVRRTRALPRLVAGQVREKPHGRSLERMRVRRLRSLALENEEQGVPKWTTSRR